MMMLMGNTSIFLYSTIYNKRLPFGASGIFAWKKRFIGIVPTNRHWGIGEPFLTALSPSDIIYSWLSPPNYEGGERLSFQEIILLLTFIGSCIYATVALTIKVLAFLLQNKKSRWLGLKSAAKRKHSHKAAIIMKKALRFRKAFFGAPSGTRTQDPLIKSQLLSLVARTHGVTHSHLRCELWRGKNAKDHTVPASPET